MRTVVNPLQHQQIHQIHHLQHQQLFHQKGEEVPLPSQLLLEGFFMIEANMAASPIMVRG